MNTVDAYQERVKDTIVFSVMGTRDMGFVEDVNRVNVAVTKAWRKFIVVGNGVSLGRRTGLLGKIVEEAEQRQCLYSYREGMIERKLSTFIILSGNAGDQNSNLIHVP